jgi:hypothetical protein
MQRILSPLALLLLTACSSIGSTPNLPPESNRIEPGHAPTPFSAAEIRAACPEGRHNLFEMRSTGKEPLYQLATFLFCDEWGAEFEAVFVNEQGGQLGGTKRTSASWEQMQARASFPADATVIDRERHRVPGGSFDCWHYTITDGEGGEMEQHFWFARSLPGPPIHVEQITDGEVVFQMTLLSTGTDPDELR